MKRTLKLLAFAALAVATLAACGGKSSQKYTIKGTVPDEVEAQWIYLYSIGTDDLQVIDSAEIKDHSYAFKGVAPDTIAVMVLHPGGMNEYPAVGWNLILEPGDIVVDANEEYVQGTPLNDGFRDWMTQVGDIMRAGGDPSQLQAFFDAHWDEHSQDFVGAFVLVSMSQILELPYVDDLAKDVPDEIKQNYMLQPFFEQLESMSERIEAMRAVKPGMPYVDMELTTTAGKSARLSDYIGKGQYTLVDFWASWCRPCREAMPELQAVVKDCKGLTVIGIAVSDKLDDTKQAIKDLDIRWPVLCDEQGSSAATYGVTAIPATLLFDPEGKLVAKNFALATLPELMQ